ncbi:hypothetical protein GGI04_002275, partial [Coemansia thaxteri]
TTFATLTSSVALWTIFASSAGALAVPPLEKRIIGGFDVPDNSASFAVYLEFTKPFGRGFCGGTIISPKHIVTAAQCVLNDMNQVYRVNDTTIGYGNVYRSKQKQIRPTKITVHPKFVPSTDSSHNLNDVAIIEVEGLDWTSSIREISIYAGAIPAGQSIIALGWGSTVASSDSNEWPDKLKGAKLQVGDAAGCQVFDTEYKSSDGPRICTLNKYNPGTATCRGDSGTGALLAVNNKLYLAGLGSEGGRLNDPTCGTADGYSLFTHVSPMMDFITKTTGYTAEYLTRA